MARSQPHGQLTGASAGSLVLSEAVGDKRRDGVQSIRRLGSRRGDGNRHSRAGAERQNTHDRGSADGLSAAAYGDRRVEPIDTLHEFRGRACVEPLAIDDFEGAHEDRPPAALKSGQSPGSSRVRIVAAHLPPRNLLAT